MIQWLIWYVTGLNRPEAAAISDEIAAEFEALYRESGFLSGAKFMSISFMFIFGDLQEQIKLGRIGKSGVLRANIVLDSTRWERTSRQELKDYMRLAMMQAVVMAGTRYKLPVAPFVAKLKGLHSRLDKIPEAKKAWLLPPSRQTP